MVLVACWLAGFWLLWRVPRLPHPGAVGARAPCSIVVPARDEAATLPHLLGSLAPQLAPGDEVVVVDDHSADATAVVAAAAGATVVAAPDPRIGWRRRRRTSDGSTRRCRCD